MTDLAHILLTAAVGFGCAVLMWIWLAKRCSAAGTSRWRAVLFCLPLVMIPLFYGAFWLMFFSNAKAAVQMHAVSLTLNHFVGPFVPWLAVGWLMASLALLLPLRKSSFAPAAPQTR